MTTISVIGLGKLGTPMLAVFADAGYDVIGVDVNAATVDAINAGRVPDGIVEPFVQDILTARKGNYWAISGSAEAIRQSGATFVIVPTPSGPDGGFTLDYLTPACKDIGRTLGGKPDYHVVVIVSTVMPGQTAELCALLERESGKRHGVDFGLIYSPEFIALGDVVRGLQQPDYVIMGHEGDMRAYETVVDIYRQTAPGVDVVSTSWVNAEIAKIAQNAFITMKITFANQLGQLCQAIPGANVDDVTFALGHDRRIGPKYLRAGTAFGGPCFPRDNRALILTASIHNAEFPMSEAVDTLNYGINYPLYRLVWEQIKNSTGTVGVLGLAYKSGTPVIEESAAIELAHSLVAAQIDTIAYDPLAMTEARAVLGDKVQYADSAQACIDAADVVVLMHPDYVPAPLSAWAGKTIIDPWRSFDVKPSDYVNGTPVNYTHIPLGIGPAEKERVR